MRTLCCLVVLSTFAACIRPRYAHYAVDRYAFSRGTTTASGWLEPAPDPPLSKLSQISPGQHLVLSCADFDRGLRFEAIVTPTDGRFDVLTLSRGEATPATHDQRSFLAPLLDVDVSLLTPSERAPTYASHRRELERVISADPLSGLEALAADGMALFPSDADDLLTRAIRHARATAPLLASAIDLAARRRPAGPALRGWLRSGGAARVLERVLGEPACTREIALKAAEDAISDVVHGDRERVLASVLHRTDLTPADLRVMLKGAIEAPLTSSERRAAMTRIARHAAADEETLRAILGGLDALAFSSHRRDVLAAMLDSRTPTEALLLELVQTAGAPLDYDDDREAVFLAAARHANATPAVRQAILDRLDAFRFAGPRSRVEAAAKENP
ncbi:MAG: hypothetical protein HYY16_14345 [Planctomycetes bacterium]|nr:hypothetical protein [Planctomycetota bacterium]